MIEFTILDIFLIFDYNINTMYKELKNSITLYYEDLGNRNGETILFIHGNSEDHHLFDEYIDDFKDKYRLILVDSRCHGLSTDTNELHYSSIEEDIILLLKELDIRKCHIIGSSDGAIISLLLSRDTDLVDKCFAIGPNINPSGLLDSVIEDFKLREEDKYIKLMLNEPNIEPESLHLIKNRVILISGECDCIKKEHIDLIKDNIFNASNYVIKDANHFIVNNAKNKLMSIIIKELELDIYYEDNHVIVVDKKCGILSQEDITNTPNLLDIVKDYLKFKYDKPGNVYLSLIQRLDRNVSGLMVLAKTTKANTRLNEIRPHKNYYAVVYGKPNKKEDTLVDFLLKDETRHMAYSGSDGKKAVLHYNVIEEKDNLSLLDISIDTGRFHQIRYQLSKIGYPIYNDMKYNPDIIGTSFELGLDAYKVTFIHPITKEEITIERKPRRDIFNKFNI